MLKKKKIIRIILRMKMIKLLKKKKNINQMNLQQKIIKRRIKIIMKMEEMILM